MTVKISEHRWKYNVASPGVPFHLKCGWKYNVASPGVLPMMAYTGKLRPKGVPFSGLRYMKG